MEGFAFDGIPFRCMYHKIVGDIEMKGRHDFQVEPPYTEIQIHACIQ